ncbi:MAG: ABC transporter permease [Chloroflexota bacterium]
MNWKIIFSILRKDLLDATRDARVLMALIVPIGIGVFYNFTAGDDPANPNATVAYTAAGETVLFDSIEGAGGGVINVSFEEFDTPDGVRNRIADDDADLGLIVPSGFDEAIEAGNTPELEVILPDDPGVSSEFIVSSLTAALREMAGQEPPVDIQINALSPSEAEETIFDQVGTQTYLVLAAALMFVGFVAMLAMPVTLTEEVEKKTIEALALIASYRDIIIAKALLGFLYVAVGLPLLMYITNQLPDDTPTFAGAAALVSIALLGFGLFIGVLFRNANQLNTWAGVFLIPVVAPAFMVGLPLPDALDPVLLAHPVSQAMRLMINAMSGEQFYGNVALSWAVIAGWGVIGYALLGWRLRQQYA